MARRAQPATAPPAASIRKTTGIMIRPEKIAPPRLSLASQAEALATPCVWASATIRGLPSAADATRNVAAMIMMDVVRPASSAAHAAVSSPSLNRPRRPLASAAAAGIARQASRYTPLPGSGPCHRPISDGRAMYRAAAAPMTSHAASAYRPLRRVAGNRRGRSHAAPR
jgi:hypothetical protein